MRKKNRFLTGSFDITSCFCSIVVIRKYKLLPYLYKFAVPTFIIIIKQNPITKTEKKDTKNKNKNCHKKKNVFVGKQKHMM